MKYTELSESMQEQARENFTDRDDFVASYLIGYIDEEIEKQKELLIGCGLESVNIQYDYNKDITISGIANNKQIVFKSLYDNNIENEYLLQLCYRVADNLDMMRWNFEGLQDYIEDTFMNFEFDENGNIIKGV